MLLSQNLKHKIDNRYRVNMQLDNLPVTVYDLLDEVSAEVAVYCCWMMGLLCTAG